MSSNYPEIAVVMSTYNGAPHLVEQIESVLAQDAPCVRLYVRDDGSRDDTVQILRSYEEQGKLTLLTGSNKGVVPSFLELTALVADHASYVAFCDQDDVWYPDKLSRAVELLGEPSSQTPKLYCAEYTLCDQDMHAQGRSHNNRIGASFARLLYENIAWGNTCVMNQALAKEVALADPDRVYYHDWWVALVASALGELVYDDFSCLDYRRTGTNVSPSGERGLSLLRQRIKKFIAQDQLSRITEQLQYLYELYGTRMPSTRRDILEHFLNDSRVSKALTPMRLRQKWPDDAALRLLFLAGRL